MTRFNMPVVPVDETDTHADGCKFKIDCVTMPLYFRNVFSEAEVDALEFQIFRKTFDDGVKVLFANPTSSYVNRTFALSFSAEEGYHIAKIYQGLTACTYWHDDNTIKLIGQENPSLYPFPKFSVYFHNSRTKDAELIVLTAENGKPKVFHRKDNLPNLKDNRLFISVGNGSKYFTPTIIDKDCVIYVNPAFKAFERGDGSYFTKVGDYFKMAIPSSVELQLVVEDDLVSAVSSAAPRNSVFVGYSKSTTAKARSISNNKNSRRDKKKSTAFTEPKWEELPLDSDRKTDTKK